jgi:hypothetical protein
MILRPLAGVNENRCVPFIVNDFRTSRRRFATRWLPRDVLVTRSARNRAHGCAIAEKAADLGVDVRELAGDRLTLDLSEDPRRAFAKARLTVAVVVAPPSERRLQPIAPSADWRVGLAEGCLPIAATAIWSDC